MLNILDNNERQIKEIVVPRGIRFISDWEDYSLNYFQFPHILDKKIPGCGYTEYCIRCNIPIILCSPRLMLLENKYQQHPEVFYFKNDLDEELDTGKDLNRISTKSLEEFEEEEEIVVVDKEKEKLEKIKEHIKQLEKRLLDYLNLCLANNQTPKILVTYDSFRHVKEILINNYLFNDFQVVIDEFQSIFTDSKFKSTTELEFVNQLENVQKVCYVSATPMIDSYLKRIDAFSSLPYYELDWVSEDPLRAIVPDLKIRTCESVQAPAKEIIKTYKEGKFESLTYKDDKEFLVVVESREAVFYVNSVSNILSIIKATNLLPDEVNILCARTSKNEKKIKERLGGKYSIGSIPLEGEVHKMFTFCTRTVYLGADFYSTNARTFILSDANIDSLSVDISLDLPQILGRQRLNSNPWKNRAEFYYKTLNTKKKMTKDDFEKILKRKLKKTNNLLDAYNTAKDTARHDLAETFKRDAIVSNYKFNYVAVNCHGGKDLVPVFNDLVVVAEQRCFDIQQFDYKDRFAVFNTMMENNLIVNKESKVVQNFLYFFNNMCESFYDKMKYLCEINFSKEELSVVLDQIPLTYKTFYLSLGVEKCRALGYNYTDISRELSDQLFDKDKLKASITSLFNTGERYSKEEIKSKLANLYSDIGYNKTAKAVDLEKYYILKDVIIIDPETKKRYNGFKLVSLIEEFKYL